MDGVGFGEKKKGLLPSPMFHRCWTATLEDMEFLRRNGEHSAVGGSGEQQVSFGVWSFGTVRCEGFVLVIFEGFFDGIMKEAGRKGFSRYKYE
jgi:hypothetical protein